MQSVAAMFVYWLIQRDDEHNRTIDVLYSTVYLWLVMCYVEMIKIQTSGLIICLCYKNCVTIDWLCLNV